MEAADLPKRYAGFSTCFRREAGAAGRDTRGHLPGPPVRQGRDVQLRRAPASSERSMSGILAIQERILTALEIPYRVVDVAVGDLGAPAARKFDCEAWIPSQETLPGGDKLLQHHRLPGKTPVQPVPSRARRIPGTRAHAERNCGGCGSNPDRVAGERAEGGRKRESSGRLAGIRRSRKDSHIDEPASTPKRVVLCDDHEIVREAIKARMADVEGVEIVGEAETGEEVVEKSSRSWSRTSASSTSSCPARTASTPPRTSSRPAPRRG